ncbi:MAG: hypothetical protein JXB07_19990 [Anaerolineae bacterium]|nr:hypothetical protein [Anaerolineae bacterium]
MSISDMMPIFFFVGFAILVVALIVGINRYHARRFAELLVRLDQLAMERGWHYRGSRLDDTERHTFTGETNGVSWQIESLRRSSSGESNSPMGHTRWWTEAVSLSDEAVLLLPNMGSVFQSLGTGGAPSGSIAEKFGGLIHIVLRRFATDILNASPDDASVLESIRPVQEGSEALRDRYTILATGTMAAGRFLDADAEQMLLELAPKSQRSGQGMRAMMVIFWHKGIQVIVEGQIVDVDRLEQLIRLGLALASGQKSSVWS